MNSEQGHDLKSRIWMSAGIIIFFVLCLFLSFYPSFAPVFAVLVALLAIGGLWEYFHIAQAKNLCPANNTAYAVSTGFILSYFAVQAYAWPEIIPWIVLVIGSLLLVARYFFQCKDAIVHSAVSVFGLLYVSAPVGLFIPIRYFPCSLSPEIGSWWLIYLIAVVKATDVGALFVGRKFGRFRLAGAISPGKTWEGAIGGLASGLIVSMIMYSVAAAAELTELTVTFFQAVWFGLLLSAAGQVGDLIESLLKRDAGIKDSNKIPGLGGILDVLDSILLTAPIVYLFMRSKF